MGGQRRSSPSFPSSSSLATLSCDFVSLLLIVTLPSFSDWKSIVMQKGVPTSSARAYLFPIDPPSSEKVSNLSLSFRKMRLDSSGTPALLARGNTPLWSGGGEER